VPYPEHLPRRPNAYSRGEVWLYVNGHKRKWLQYDAGPDGLPIIPNDKGKGKGKGKAKDNEQAREDEEWGINAEDMDDEVEPEVEEEADMDLEIDEEEAAMNGPKKVLIKVLEDEEEKHQKHEPLVCVLQHYDTVSSIDPAFDALLTPSINSSALSSSSRHSPPRSSTSYPHSSLSHLLLNPVPPHSPPSTLAGYSPASFSLTINSTAIIWRLFAI
jgi:hypothetical protein